MGKSWSEQQQQVQKIWEQYGVDGLRFAYGLTGELSLAQDLVYSTCVDTYRRLATDQHRYSGARNALFAAILRMYRGWDGQHAEKLGKDVFAQKTCNGVRLVDVSALQIELKAPLLLYSICGCSTLEMTRILLLPDRWIHRRLGESAEALGWIDKGNESWSTIAGVLDAHKEALMREAVHIYVGQAVQNRIRQLVTAAAAMVAAEKRQMGSNGVRFVFAALIALGAGLTGYGIDGWHQEQKGITIGTTANEAVKGLPQTLRNLPVNIIAQFRLSNTADAIPLNHIAAADNGIYLAKLHLPTSSWPSIELSLCPYSASGKSLESYETSAGKMDMVPPLTNPKTTAENSDWTVGDWQVGITGDWMVTWVRWQPGTPQELPVTQVYLMYLPTQHAGLVQSLELSKGRDLLTLAVGSGRLVEQYGFHTSTSNTGVSGLPISVYTLRGKLPLQALGKPVQIPAPFGLMADAEVRSGELIFQGIVGQTPGVSDKATWYSLSWDGQLTKLTGPPLDGQPHWALRGISGRLWWVETTPANGDKRQWQVLMGQVSSPAGLDQSAAYTLNGTVSDFTVSEDRLVWIQVTQGVPQLVVAEPS
ncbi:hypothetical protein D2Q93_01075 [Alicyclobacillaceae bacterium I2511]|nr:hypothetical protein D2Q93_01075 [Alicyclobacillaceae bacterium I2511]